MTTLLSSRLTFAMKSVFPAIWLGGWGYATALLLTDPSRWQEAEVPPVWEKWVFLGFLVLGSVIFQRVCYPLKRVILEDGFLRISNFLREIRVSLSEVQEAGFDQDAVISLQVGPLVQRRVLVGLNLRNETPFGQSIVFLPKSSTAVELLRARLGPSVGAPLDPPKDPLAEERRGRGTV